MARKNSYIKVSKKKKNEGSTGYQTSIFDFLEADNDLFPLEATSIGCALDMVNPFICYELESSTYSWLVELGKYMENFKVPYFALPDEPDRVYTKVLVNNTKYKLSKHYIVSNDLLVKVVDNQGNIEEVHPLENGLFRLNITDGRNFYMNRVDIALASFFGIRIWVKPDDLSVDTEDSIYHITNLFDLTLRFFSEGRIYLLEDVRHNLTNIRVEQVVDPVLPTDPNAEAEPDLTQPIGEETGEVDHQPSYSGNLIPVDIYGIKDGYFYDPVQKQVVSPIHNIIVSHRLTKDGTVQLEAISHDPQVVPLVTVNLDELHAVIYEGKKLLPTSHIIVEGEPDPQLKIDMETVPLALTAEMKEMIKKAGAGDNRQLAASVYGGKVTPEHTKIVKSYKKYLQEQKDIETE